MIKFPSVTIIVPMYNVERVLEQSLESIVIQTYPIQKIILVDNRSTDQSVSIARKFATFYNTIPICIIERNKTYGLSDSYNLGAKLAKSSFVVTLHSDSMLPTKYELRKLMQPFIKHKQVYAAAMPRVVHRKEDWRSYNFWQKCLFAQVVGTEQHNLNGKFDVYDRAVFLKLGGYDSKNFNHYIGSEDADMHFRLIAYGKIAATAARVVHLHGRDDTYGLQDWLKRRKFLAISYARQMQLHWMDMGIDILTFFVKPALSLLTIGGVFYPLLIIPITIFPFWYMRNMFGDSVSRKDRNILLLPCIVIYLVFAETYWMMKDLFRKRYSV